MRLDENLSEEITIFGLEKGNTIGTIYNRELKYLNGQKTEQFVDFFYENTIHKQNLLR